MMKKFTESKKDFTQLQTEYNNILDKIASAKEELTDFESSIASKGLFINKSGIIEEDEKLWGVFWDIEEYDHYDGHAGDAIYREMSGALALEVNRKLYNGDEYDETESLKKILIYWTDMDFEEKIKTLQDLVNKTLVSVYPFVSFLEKREYGSSEETEEDYFDRVKVEVGENSIRIECLSEADDEGDLCQGSFVCYRPTNWNELNKIKNVNRTYN